ncbi:MAG TPA: enolase C-terminal domain-like protein [Candidatus Baltobacteraceae bacterium]|nr:enolase C-terminal domain-like protein [Candidatus Baltobacteraceae bacterium]
MLDLRIERVETLPVALPTRATFAVSGGSVARAGEPSVRVLVKVTASDGTFGWGEATPIPSWTYETLESIATTIDRYLAPVARGIAVWDTDALARAFDRAINRGFSIGAPLAKAAVDVAVHDVLGKALSLPVYALLGGLRAERIPLGWIVSTEGAGGAEASVREGCERGYRAFKIKVGLHGELDDVRTVERVRAAAGDGAFLWVDANQGYTVDVALRVAHAMQSLGVAAFEQPLPSNDVEGLRRLRDRSPIPVALDESLRHPTDLATFVKLGAVDVAIAKVQRSGGLTLSRRLCRYALDSGVRLMGSGLTESDVGLAASLHLFGAFGIETPVDLNGRQFIDSPYAARTVEIADGVARVPNRPGLGVDVDEEWVRAHRVPVRGL